MNSHRKIDYRLRPAKFVERILFCEAFKRIPFSSLEDYHYIGMGSLYFSDFRLFHKALGIEKMTSIEGVGQNKDRFDYNKPFSCLDIKYELTGSFLPKVDYSEKLLMWLDYDGAISLDILSDIKIACNRFSSGGFFAVSIAANSLKLVNGFKNDEKKSPLEILQDMVGRDRIPAGTKSDDLSEKGTAGVLYKIIIAEIETALSIRNQQLEDSQKIEFKQIFHIRYNDGTPMLTIGGIFIKKISLATFRKAKYSKQDYYQSGNKALKIDVPLLTNREILALEKIAPSLDINNIKIEEIDHKTFAPEKEILSFLKTYRFLPNYVPAELA